MVVDQQAIAGALVARRRGGRLAWATSATTSAEMVDPFSLLPKVGEWVTERLRDFQLGLGVQEADAAQGDLRFSDQLVLAFTTRALAGPGRAFPAHYRFVGPSLGSRPASVEFPWAWLDPARQHVLVSLGTINGADGRRFLSEAVAALASMADRVQGVVVGPIDLMASADVPDNVVIRAFVPQLALLPSIDAVVSHGGHNTVCESLAHGLPLVVAPIRDDQPIIAQQVADAGAGIRVRFGRVRGPELAAAVGAVLGHPGGQPGGHPGGHPGHPGGGQPGYPGGGQPGYRAAAQRIQASFQAAGGPASAADALEALAAGGGGGPADSADAAGTAETTPSEAGAGAPVTPGGPATGRCSTIPA